MKRLPSNLMAGFILLQLTAAGCGGSSGSDEAGRAGTGGVAARDDAGKSASAGSRAGAGGKAAAANGGSGAGGKIAAAGKGAAGQHSTTAGRDAAVGDDAGPGAPADDARSCKRGVGYGFDPDGARSDLQALASGVTWYYGWANGPNAQLTGQYQKLGVEFVPMVWGGSFKVDDVVAKIPDGARFLLGFNEPNFNGQANLTPQKAAELWPQIEDIARQKKLAIVSPALNYCGGGCNVDKPTDWLDQFFAACKDCKVDYVAVHWYACSGDALRSYVAMFKKYGKPIWLTEFSCGDSGTQPVSKQQSYMKEALTYLESDKDIFRYAWFSGRTTAIANVDLLGATGTLTDLGKDYVSLPSSGATCSPP